LCSTSKLRTAPASKLLHWAFIYPDERHLLCSTSRTLPANKCRSGQDDHRDQFLLRSAERCDAKDTSSAVLGVKLGNAVNLLSTCCCSFRLNITAAHPSHTTNKLTTIIRFHLSTTHNTGVRINMPE
jgi:hypothetical protein